MTESYKMREVVRCKDCKHRDPETKKCDCGCWHFPFVTEDDDFCSYGETKMETPITPKPRLCKDCKFFEYDSVVEVDGIPLIVAHETCKKWGGGCKTEEDGYCFLFEPKEGEER